MSVVREEENEACIRIIERRRCGCYKERGERGERASSSIRSISIG